MQLPNHPPVDKTVVAWFRQSKTEHFWSILERFIPQNLRVKAQSGLRVNFKCYQRSLESVNNFTSSVNAVTQEGLNEGVEGSALQLKLKF